MTSAELGVTDRLYYPWATIDALPDNVLLETFEFYLGKDDPNHIGPINSYDGWQTLVHVCGRWRCIVFASPRRLDLKLYCPVHISRSVKSKTLDIWPVLPIVIHAVSMRSKEDIANVIPALRQHSRVCKLEIFFFRDGQYSLLKEFAEMDEPFPALTSLHLFSVEPKSQNVPVLPDSFLGRSAPRLRSLCLDGIPYPSIGKLLPSTTNLVRLTLCRIPHSGYIAPETIIPCLSSLARLESLILEFKYPRSRVHRASRHPPPLTRVVIPNLICLHFRGDIEYSEDILSQIETPMLNESQFCFFNQLVFDTSLLGHFIRRTEIFMTTHRIRVEFSSLNVEVTLLGQEEMANSDGKALLLRIYCKPLDSQLSAVAQVLNSSFSSLPTLESLEITVPRRGQQGDTEVIQWLEFLHPFTFVKEMALETKDSVRHIAPALQELAGERAIEVLPSLQNLSLRAYRRQPSGPAKEAIKQFIAARQLYGHPVTVHYQDIKKSGVGTLEGQ